MRSWVEEANPILRLGTELEGRRMAAPREWHICNKVGGGEKREKLIFELINYVLEFQGL